MTVELARTPRPACRLYASCMLSAGAWVIEDATGAREPWDDLHTAFGSRVNGTPRATALAALARRGIRVEEKFEPAAVALTSLPAIVIMNGLPSPGTLTPWPDPSDVSAEPLESISVVYPAVAVEEHRAARANNPARSHACYVRGASGDRVQLWDSAGGAGYVRRARLVREARQRRLTPTAEWRAYTTYNIRETAARVAVATTEIESLIESAATWQRLAHIEAALARVEWLVEVDDAAELALELRNLLALSPGDEPLTSDLWSAADVGHGVSSHLWADHVHVIRILGTEAAADEVTNQRGDEPQGD